MSTVLTSQPSDDRFAASGERSVEEFALIAERTAHDLLGVSAEKAFQMLDRGELEGTLAESALEGLRYVLDS